MRQTLPILTLILLAASLAATLAATPPDRINYQGVLRDSFDNPISATYNVLFRLYNSPSSGSEMLVDQHLVANAQGVSFQDGLFNAEIGGGDVIDGSGPGVYTSLADVFRVQGEVWVTVQVNGEELSPRVPIRSAGHALNANHAENAETLGGLSAANFIDTSAALQTKTGPLTIGSDLTLGGIIDSTNGPRITPTPDILRLQAGSDDTDDLWLVAGNDNSDGRIQIDGDQAIGLWSGNGLFNFFNAATGIQVAQLNNLGDLQIDGGLTVDGGEINHGGNMDIGGTLTLSGNHIDFGSGATVDANSSVLYVQAGDSDTDQLLLQAGNDSSDGRIAMFGDLWMELKSGNGEFRFLDGNAGSVERARLEASGTLQLDGDLTLDGNDLRFGNGSQLLSNSTAAIFYGGADATDDIILRASINSGTAGGIDLLGNGAIAFKAGNGAYNFFATGSSTLTAFLDNAGNLDLDGKLDLDAGDIYMVETGSDQTQDIHFREDGLSSGERFEWDDPNDRFEVSDDFHVYGQLTATTKNFVQNHPFRDDLEIVYTSLEGDESTTFTRGFGRLENGEARIRLGETFAYVTNPDVGISAHLTPRGDWADLYVVELTTQELVVRAAPGDPDVAFDFIVFGLRIGFEEFPVMRAKRAESYLPPEGSYFASLDGDSALTEATAMSRYRQMEARVHGPAELDLTAARGLANAIGRRPLGFDYPTGQEMSVAAIMAAGAGGIADVEPVIEQPDLTPDPTTGQNERTNDAGSALAANPRRDDDGNVYADSFRSGAGELATMLPAGESLDAGDVVSIDPQSGLMVRATANADRAVFGVVAADAGVVLGAREDDGANSEIPIAMSGIVLCNVDASYGVILPGDLLVTSETSGHARRDDDPAVGTVLGKALDRLEVGIGQIRVLVTLR